MSTATTYRIRPADSRDLAACLDLWAEKARALSLAGTPQRVIDQGRQIIGSWIENGVMQLVVTETGDVVACLAPSGDATGLRTPAEVTLLSEHTELPPPAGRTGPLARALREVAVTRDDLATARRLSTDDDTFAVEADMLQRRLHDLETRLTTLQAAIAPDATAGVATVWTEAATAITQLKVDAAPSGTDPWNAALTHAARVLSDRARAAREASDDAAQPPTTSVRQA